MALTELQLPSKTDFYNVISNTAGEISQAMHRWGKVADFINRMGASDLDAIGAATGQVRTDIVNLRILLNELNDLWNNEAVTPTNDPQAVVEELRKINHG